MIETIRRISWLDYGKALCMLVTMLFHAEVMCAGETSLFTDLVFFNTSMVFFFFVSGYLTNIQTFSLKKSLTSLIKRLLIPYFIFTTIIYVPKYLLRGWDFNIITMASDIFGGVASWFVAALIVSKLVILIVLRFTKNLYILGIVCLLFTIFGFFITHYFAHPLPWNINYGFISMIYLFIGILYRKYECQLSFNKIPQAIVSTLLFLVLAFCNNMLDLSSYIYALKQGQVEFLEVLVYLVISGIGVWMIISLMKLIPSGIKWLSYIGVNSLTYYYLNTGVLLVLITIMNKLGVQPNYLFVLLEFIVMIICVTIASEIILRFAPWMVGMKSKNSL